MVGFSSRISEAELKVLRNISLIEVLDYLGFSWVEDQEFHPRKNQDTRRIIVELGDSSRKFVITGLRWQEVETLQGGGGAIDFVMYLLDVNFLEAVRKLSRMVK